MDKQIIDNKDLYVAPAVKVIELEMTEGVMSVSSQDNNGGSKAFGWDWGEW